MHHLNDLYYVAAILISVGIAYYLGIFTGAHYIPTTREKVARMLHLARLAPSERLVDIGSGDGRLVIEAARQGAMAYGFELNPILVLLSRQNIRAVHVETHAEVSWKDFWHQDFSGFDVVTVFGISHIMGLLEKKLLHELKPGARVVCNTFPFPTWEGKKEGGLFVYVKT